MKVIKCYLKRRYLNLIDTIIRNLAVLILWHGWTKLIVQKWPVHCGYFHIIKRTGMTSADSGCCCGSTCCSTGCMDSRRLDTHCIRNRHCTRNYFEDSCNRRNRNCSHCCNHCNQFCTLPWPKSRFSRTFPDSICRRHTFPGGIYRRHTFPSGIYHRHKIRMQGGRSMGNRNKHRCKVRCRKLRCSSYCSRTLHLKIEQIV